MRFADGYKFITTLFESTNRIAPFLIGEPGGGKTALAKAVGNAFDFDQVMLFHPSLRDPTDLLGLPNTNGECAKWLPPEEFYRLREGRNLLIIDEASDATVPMQNGLCALVEDHQVNNVKLSPETYIILTGNRTEDKSGANRLTSKFANRVVFLEYQSNIDDWSNWAIEQGKDPMLIQFLRFAPDLLSKFDPNRRCNPTPRQWEKVSLIPDKLPFDIYMAGVEGLVGAEAAAKYSTFKRLLDKMPNPDEVILKPDNFEVPKESGIRYALTGALSRRTTKDNFGRVMKFIEKNPPELQAYFVKDTVKLVPDVRFTKDFAAFAVKNANLLL